MFILGASNKEDDNDGENFLSELNIYQQFKMLFEFAVESNDSNVVSSIENEDITDKEHGFLNDSDLE